MFIFLLLIYLVMLMAVSWWVSRDESSEAFLIAGRDRPWWQIMASKYAASVGAGWFLAYAGFAYEYGWPLALIFIGGMLGIILYSTWAVAKIRQGNNAVAYTQSDFVFSTTNNLWSRRLTDGAVVLVTVSTLLIAVVGAATLIDSYGYLTYERAVVLTVLVVAGYVYLAGYKAVVITDLIQGALLIGMLSLITIGVLQTEPVQLQTMFESRNISVIGIAMLAVFGFLAVFADPTRYQITFAGTDDQTVKKGMYLTVIPLLLTSVAIFFIGNSVYQFDQALTSAEVFPTALTEFLPETLSALGFLIFFIALMSTADSYLYGLASHTAKYISPNSKLSRASVANSILGYSFLLVVASLLIRDVLEITIMAAAFLLMISVPMIYLIFGGVSGPRFNALLICGFIGVWAGVAIIGLKPDAAIFVLLGFVVASLIPKRFINRLGDTALSN